MNWIAFVAILSGNLCIGDKKKIGFLFIAAGSLIWIKIGFDIKDYALVMVNVSGTIIMIRNWIRWKEEEKYWNSMVISDCRIKWWQIWK